tara:strand:- start:628 stop:918 length:291 start_codon:yes stop_codon:yes gene_type:complete
MTRHTYYTHEEDHKYAFTVTPQKIRFGVGSLRRVNCDAQALSISIVALYIDKTVAQFKCISTVKGALSKASIDNAILEKFETDLTTRSSKYTMQYW